MRQLAGAILAIMVLSGLVTAGEASKDAKDVTPDVVKNRVLGNAISERIIFHPEYGTIETVSGRFVITEGSSLIEKAYRFIDGKRDAFRLQSPVQELELISEEVDHLGLAHLRFRQVYRQVPVWGNQLIVHFADNGTIYMAGGQIIATPTFEITPSVGEEAAGQAALDNLKGDIDPDVARVQSELVIYPNDGNPRLSRLVTVTDSDNPSVRWRVFVDAETGAVLFKFNDIHFDGPDTGTGYDVLGYNHSFPIYQEGGIYKLRDVTRTGEIRTYVDYLNGGSLSEDLDGDKAWDDSISQRAEVAGHVYAGWIYDYFKNTHGRESYDGYGADVIVNAHDPRYTNNAYWNGVAVNFGDGDGYNYLPFSGAADVVAHELTHGVTEYNGNGGLIYSFQSGALNESYSDVFGSAVDPGDWLLGEDIRLSPPGFIRSMEDPTLRNHPKHMNDYRYLSIDDDNGGVHINCGISNHAYYRVVDIYGMNRARADSVWYRTLITYLTPASGFYFWAGMLTQAAVDLYGFNSTEHIAVENALIDVGLGTVYAYPQSFTLTALLGTVGSNSLWLHNKGGYAGDPSIIDQSPSLPGLSLAPGPGYKATIPTGDSSEYILTYDATALTQCNLGSYWDTLQFYVDGALGITELRVPVLVGVGLTSSTLTSNESATQCATLTTYNAGYATAFSRDGFDPLYGYTFMVGLRDGTDTTVYRRIFGAEGFSPVDSFTSESGASSHLLSTLDGRLQGEIQYRWDPTNSDSCEFFIAEYTLYNDCDTALNLLTAVFADFDIGMDRTGYDDSLQMVYMYDTGSRALGLALLGDTARNLRAIHNPTQVYSGAFTDGLAYREMSRTTPSEGTSTDDWSVLLTVDQDQLGGGDTVRFIVAMMYSTDGVGGLDEILVKANSFAGFGGPTYVDGDANGDGTVNVGDAVAIVDYIFRGGPAPDPLEAGDANCDGTVNIADAVYLIEYIFKGGPSPGC